MVNLKEKLDLLYRNSIKLILGKYITMNTATKQLNIEALRKIIVGVTSASHTPNDEKFNVVLEKLQTMNELLHDLSTLKDENDLQEVRRQIAICQQQSREAMEAFLNKHGTSIEQTEAYFRDPNNFSQKEWENFQRIRREVEEAVESPHPTPMRLARKNKNKEKK